jgi:hypothetical protein
MEPEEFSLKAIKKDSEQGMQEIIVTIEGHAHSKSNHESGH